MEFCVFLVTVWISIGTIDGGNDNIPVACTENFMFHRFCDPLLPTTDRVNDLISLLTLDEKAMLLTARESPVNFILRLGIPEYNWGGNCVHSVQSRCTSNCATTFPEPNMLGATFNKTLISNISAAIGLELRALWLEGAGQPHVSNLPHLGLDCWGPTINLGRDPRWGRMYEAPSEDPYWNGIYGTYFTIGIQNGSKDTIYHDPRFYQAVVTLKHFDAYSLENVTSQGITRHNFNAIVSQYMFADTYWPAFKMSIQDGGAKGVMCSYNEVNGIPSCCNSFLLNDTLRNAWHFDGYISSDTTAIERIYTTQNYTSTETEAVVQSLQATCDIDSGYGKTNWKSGWGTGSEYQDVVPPAVRDGTLDVKYVDSALFNSLKIRFDLGLFNPIDDQPYWKVPGSIINNEKHIALNLFSARCGQVLLKNDANVLPFDANDINKNNKIIGVIGPHFNASSDLLIEGAYVGQVCREYNNYDCVPGILNGIGGYVENEDNILYAIGCNDGTWCASTDGFEQAMEVANKSDYIILMFGINQNQEKEGHDRVNISLPGYQAQLVSQICNLKNKPNIVLVLINGGMIAIDQLKYECPSIIEAYYPGFQGAQAISDVVFGAFNPGGKLATTMYWSNYTIVSNYTDMDISNGKGKTYKYWSGTTPLYSFGYGLSYTSFVFTDESSGDGCDITKYQYCIQITNNGNREGHETIFVFLYPPSKTIPNNEPAKKIIKKLIFFEKYFLQKSESVIFKYQLNTNEDLVLYNSNGEPVIFEGQYELEFSNGVDQSLKYSFNVNNTNTLDFQ